MTEPMQNPTGSHPTTSTKSSAKSKASAAKSAVRKAKRAGKATASAVADTTESVAEQAINTAAQRAERLVTSGQNQTEDVVRAIGRAFDAGSRSLEEDGMAGTAGYVRAAANGLQQAANEVDGFNAGSLTSRVENFVRERPMLTVGALAMAGFALASSLKSKNDRS